MCNYISRFMWSGISWTRATLPLDSGALYTWDKMWKGVSFSSYLQKIYIQHPYLSYQPFVLSSSVCVCMYFRVHVRAHVCVHPTVRRLPGKHFATICSASARWLIEHSVMSPPFHWGLSQSAQARFLNRRPHRHHSPILDESSFRGLKGLFQSLAERWRALLPLIQHQATGLFTFSQPHWLILHACDSAPCGLLIKSCQVPCIYDAAIGIHILCSGFKARLQLLQSKPTQAWCHRAGSALLASRQKYALHLFQMATCIRMPLSWHILCHCGCYCHCS